MGIKQKDENSAGGLHNALAAGTTIKGNIITETDFRLDGKVEGDISCNGKIVIGPKGSVTGNIVSENAEILGEVDGSVKVSAKLILKSTAIIKGDIYTQRSNQTHGSTEPARCVPRKRKRTNRLRAALFDTALSLSYFRPASFINETILLFRLSACKSCSNVICIR